jgi:hypothetical protein
MELYQVLEVVFIYLSLSFHCGLLVTVRTFFSLLVMHNIHTCKQNMSYFECINYLPCAKFVI